MSHVDTVFIKYDRDRSGFLSLDEIAGFFNECLANSGSCRRVTQYEAVDYMRKMDRNMDGRISKLELYSGLKAILNDQQGYSAQQDQPRHEQFLAEERQQNCYGNNNNYCKGYNPSPTVIAGNGVRITYR